MHRIPAYLNHTMLLHIHKERTDELDLVEIAKNFIAINDRRARPCDSSSYHESPGDQPKLHWFCI